MEPKGKGGKAATMSAFHALDLEEAAEEPEAEAEAGADSPSAAESGPSAAPGFADLEDEEAVEEATAADREPEAGPASGAAADAEEPEAAPAPMVSRHAVGWRLRLGCAMHPQAMHPWSRAASVLGLLQCSSAAQHVSWCESHIRPVLLPPRLVSRQGLLACLALMRPDPG